jgi:Tfp pilus assembly protein PilF
MTPVRLDPVDCAAPRIRGWALLLVLIGVGAYANCLDNPLFWDDEGAILTNPTIRRLWPLGPVLSPPPDTPVSGRPITNLSHALTYAVSGLNPVGFHAASLALHLASGLLLFGIVRRTLQVRRDEIGEPDRTLGWAWTVAALWTVHPLHTECLNYATQRSEVLAGFFLLLTFYCALRSFLALRPGWWQAAAVLSSACGMGSKEIMAGAPLLVWIYDRAFFSGSFRASLRRRMPLYAGLAATWLILLAQASVSQYPSVFEFAFSGRRPWWVYALTQSHAVLYYLRLAVWPHPLVIDYYDWPLADRLGAALPAGVVIVGLAAATVWALWKRPALGFLGAWWFLLLAPTTSLILIRTEVVAERRLYLPVIAAVILGVSLADRWLRARSRPGARSDQRLAPAYAAAVIALCLGLIFLRNLDYRSEISIWRDAVAKRPGNGRAHNNLATALVKTGAKAAGALEFQRAIQIYPAYGRALCNFGVVLSELGQPRLGLEYLDYTLALYPDFAEAHNYRGEILLSFADYDEAGRTFRRALQFSPSLAVARLNLGALLARSGQWREAEAEYREALRLVPWDAEGHRRLGGLLLQQGRAAEAQPHLALGGSRTGD